MSPVNILLYCRPGFEKECAAEIMEVTTSHEIFGYIKSKPDSGFVVFSVQAETSNKELNRLLRFDQLVFARQMLLVSELLTQLPVDARITPLLQQISTLQEKCCDVWLETADTNEGKQLSGFCKKFSTPLRQSLDQHQYLDRRSPWRLHLFFLNSSTAYVGISHIENSSPSIMGIARLKMPRSAPSRSTLKLEEAIVTMLSEAERERYLGNGMSAVDLGACPGGWTWQLVKRGLRVDAIDNGDMDQQLMQSGLVQHIKADGFKYRPRHQVNWLVCDMVERPLHISRLICRWHTEQLCQHSIFNLKLPMKQRYQMVTECRELITGELQQRGIDFELRMKQLYHDREEITCVVLTRF